MLFRSGCFERPGFSILVKPSSFRVELQAANMKIAYDFPPLPLLQTVKVFVSWRITSVPCVNLATPTSNFLPLSLKGYIKNDVPSMDVHHVPTFDWALPVEMKCSFLRRYCGYGASSVLR